MCAFAQRKLDRVLLVCFSSTVVTFVKFERDVRLEGRDDEMSFMQRVGRGGGRILTA